MNHPFYIDRQVFPGFTRSSTIIDLDQIRRLTASSKKDSDGEWCIDIDWIGPSSEPRNMLSIPFNSTEARDVCFAAVRKAIFAARQIDEEIP